MTALGKTLKFVCAPLLAATMAVTPTFAHANDDSPEAPHIKNTKQSPPSGNFADYDYRNKDVNSPFMIDAPYSASNGRVSIVFYGTHEGLAGATHFAGKEFANRGHDVKFLWAQDNDNDTGNVSVGIYGNGRKHEVITIGVDADHKQTALKVYASVNEAYERFVIPTQSTNNKLNQATEPYVNPN